MPAAAPTNNNYSGIIDVVTTQQFMRGEFDNTKKRNIILRELDARGNIKGDASGKFFERNVRVGTFASGVRGDLVERQFARRQQRVTYTVPYAWYETTGALGEQDIVFNQGQEALIRLNAVMMKNMGDDFRKDLATNLLRSNAGSATTLGQSVASASPVPLFGLPTLFGTGTTQNYNPDTQATSGAIGASDREALPNVTYCGVSTHPLNPIAGVDGKTNEATSPVIANWSSTAWTGTATWKSTALPVCDHMLNRLARSEDPADNVDLILMTRTMFTDFSQAVLSGGPSGLGSRVVFSEKSQSPNFRMYTDNVIPYGNAKAYWDVSAPANSAYFLNTNAMEFCYFPQKSYRQGGEIQGDAGAEYFGVRTDYDIKQGGHLAVAVMCANIWANPFYQGAAFNFA